MISKDEKRGPKGPRHDYEPALRFMAELRRVNRGMPVSDAARAAIKAKIAPVPQSETATVEWLRRQYRLRAKWLDDLPIPHTLADRAFAEAVHRAIVRRPALLGQLARRLDTISPATWARIRVEARTIERLLRAERELAELREIAKTQEMQQLDESTPDDDGN